MYLVSLALFLFILPLVSVIGEAMWFGDTTGGLMPLVGKWYTFWAAGVRLFAAGVTQTFRPKFTAESIFHIKDPAAQGLVREIGFGNLSIGALALASLIMPSWTVPAALAGGLYYGLAGLGHTLTKERSTKEQQALVTDIFAFLVLAAFVINALR